MHTRKYTIVFRPDKRVKRISLSLRAPNKITVVYPFFISQTEAERFLGRQHEWIKENFLKLNKHYQNFKHKYSICENTQITESKQLFINHHDKKDILWQTNSRALTIHIPRRLDKESPAVKHAVYEIVIDLLKTEAKNYLPHRTRELARQWNFNVNQIRIKNTATRWGSCSHLGNINLSCQLMRMRKELIDYIIIHELVHTVEMNHGAGFHKRVAEIVPNADALENELKEWHFYTKP